MNSPIPVIDLFAGPGGLGEGFSAYKPRNESHPFKIALSIEKDSLAHQTLQLRSFIRQFQRGAPQAYYDMLSDVSIPLAKRLKDLYDKYPDEAFCAQEESWLIELGKQNRNKVFERISQSLGKCKNWILLGGPPCQAYSLVGRSRNKGIQDYKPEADSRQFLYIEYLQVIADHSPAVFVMENVKGLLSATVNNQKVFDQIIEDLHNPAEAIFRENRLPQRNGRKPPKAKYEVFSITPKEDSTPFRLSDYIVRMEEFGIPQARHRLILLGIRTDLLNNSNPGFLKKQPFVSAIQVLSGLPRLRSGFSKEEDDEETWCDLVRNAPETSWFKQLSFHADALKLNTLKKNISKLSCPREGRGGDFVAKKSTTQYAPEWYLDNRLPGTLNHATRGHITKDLHRYFYASCFAHLHKKSPVLSDFPTPLLPAHANVKNALAGSNFADRFRVQLSSKPSTTITSHISKDGHYYIHYDPKQCRSLTVREAARLQTFPDNYFFCGPRTNQYTQVGNAVPPLLAKQIAKIVHQFLSTLGAA